MPHHQHCSIASSSPLPPSALQHRLVITAAIISMAASPRHHRASPSSASQRGNRGGLGADDVGDETLLVQLPLQRRLQFLPVQHSTAQHSTVEGCCLQTSRGLLPPEKRRGLNVCRGNSRIVVCSSLQTTKELMTADTSRGLMSAEASEGLPPVEKQRGSACHRQSHGCHLLRTSRGLLNGRPAIRTTSNPVAVAQARGAGRERCHAAGRERCQAAGPPPRRWNNTSPENPKTLKP